MAKFGIEVLVFDWGEVKVPPGASANYAAVKKRKDGEPDRRYKLGRLWWKWFWEQNVGGIDRKPVAWWKMPPSPTK